MSGIRINEIPRDSILDGQQDLVHVYKDFGGTFKSVAAPVSALAFQGPAGLDGNSGLNGIDGDNGDSIAQLVCYRRFAPDDTVEAIQLEKPGAVDANGNYNDDGSFDFSSRIFTPPDEWSNGIPAIEIGKEDWVLYSCNGVAKISGLTGRDETIIWSDPESSGIQGQPGTSGRSTYQAVVFTRKVTKPVSPTGGSFNFGANQLTPPIISDGNGNEDNWYIDVAGDLGPLDDGTQLWMCNFQFSVEGDTDTAIASTWSQTTRFAADGADGRSTYYGSIYTRSSTDISNDRPGDGVDETSGIYSFTENRYTSLPYGWTEAIPVYNGESLWVSHSVASVQGPDGEDNDLSWSLPVEVMQPAIDGNNGDAVVQLNIYTRSIGLTQADTPTGGQFNFGTRILTSPTGWSSSPYKSATDVDDPDFAYDFLYMSVGVAATSEYNIGQGSYGIDSDIVWSAPILSPNEGINGVSTYLSQVYTRYTGDEDIQTLTNAPTGGSYNFANSTLTVPVSASTGEALTWYDRIPGGLAPIYISQQQFGVIGNTGTVGGSDNWSAPAIMAYNGTAGFDGVTNKLITLYYGADTELANIPAFPSNIDLIVQLDATLDTFGKIVSEGNITVTDNQIISDTNATGWYTQIPAVAEWVYATEATAADSNESDLIKTDVIEGNEWSDTVLWRKPGSNGLVGLATGPVRLYLRNNNINAPSTTPTGPINYYVQNSGSNSRGDLVVPAGSSLNGWSLLEPSYDGTNHYLWSIVATSSTREVYDIILDDEWSAPFIYSQNPFDLTETVVSHIVQAYKRSSLPVTDNPGTVTVDLSGNSAGLIQEESLDNGWSKVIPDGDQQLYITHATASGNVSVNDGTETDTISEDEWSDGSRWGIKGDQGESGYNTTPVAIYKRTDRIPANGELDQPTGSSTYTFSTKSVSFTDAKGWSSTLPVKDATDKILWQRWSTAIDTGDGSDTIASNEWGSAINIGEDGVDGTSFVIKGNLDAISDLPANATEGDAYVIGTDLHMWDGTQWNNIGSIQGPAGEVGASSFIHIKYASGVTYNSSGDITAVTLTSNSGEDVGDYMGVHVSSTEADPSVEINTGAPYKWKLLQGKEGRTAGTIAYAAYSNSNPDTITYNSTEDALVLQSDTDSSIGMAYPAFNVSDFAGTDKKIKFDIPVKSNASSDAGFYIRVYEYDDVLPAGKLAINGSPNPEGGEYGAGNSPEVQLGTRIRYQTPRFENQPISTEYQIKSFEYIPTITAKYASVVILNWAGMGSSELYVKPVIGNIVGGSGADGIPGQTPVVINVYKKVGLGAPAPDAPGAGTYNKGTGVFTFNSNASNGWSVTTPNAESGKRIYITSATVIYPANSTTGTVSVPYTSWANIIDGKATVTWSSVPGRTAPAVSRIADYKYLNLYLAGINEQSPWSNGQYYFGKSGTQHFNNTVNNMVAGDSIDDINTLGFSLKSSSGADMSQFISDTELTQEILFKQGASWILFKRLSAGKNVRTFGKYIDVEVVDKSENLSTISDLEYIVAAFTDATTLPTGAEVAAIFGYTPAIARDTVYLYQRSDSTTVPGDPTGDYSYNFNTETLTLVNGAPNGWSSTIDGSNGKYLWRLHATASGTIDSGSNVFTDTITPSEWSVMLISQDGIDGATGTSFSQKFLYTRTATSTPTFLESGWNSTTQPVQLQVAVANTGSDIIGRVRSTDASDLVRTGVTWFEDIPDQTNGDHLWVIVAPVISTGTNDYVTIPNTAWAEPVKLSQNGVGLNTATIRLYKRTSGAAPAGADTNPSTQLTYNFLTGNVTDYGAATNLKGWTVGIPTTGGSTLWVIRAIASSIGTTDSIGIAQWSAPEILVTDGAGMIFIGSFASRNAYIEYINNSPVYNGIPPVNSYHIEPETLGGVLTERKVSLLYIGGQNTADKSIGTNFEQLTIDGKDGVAGQDGVSLTFKTARPDNPTLGDMYKNSSTGIVYVYDGNNWQVLINDGSDGSNGSNGDAGAVGPDGNSVFVTYSKKLLSNEPDEPASTSNGNVSDVWSTTASADANWISQKIAREADDAGIAWSQPIKIAGEVGEAGYETITLTCYRRADTRSNAGQPTGGGYDFARKRFSPPSSWSSTVRNAESNYAVETATSDEIGREWDFNFSTQSNRNNVANAGKVLWSSTAVATVQTTASIQQDTTLTWGTPKLQTLNGVDLVDDSVSVDRVFGAVKNGGGVQKIVATDRNNNLLTQAAYNALGDYSATAARANYGWVLGDDIDPETFYIIF
tara:strand:+ start:1184 stop:7921 length:6738 start_codon:yes stop_codon:yes gene_type:complete